MKKHGSALSFPALPQGRPLRETTYLGTSPEAHASDQAVYKVQILPPGAQPSGITARTLLAS